MHGRWTMYTLLCHATWPTPGDDGTGTSEPQPTISVRLCGTASGHGQIPSNNIGIGGQVPGRCDIPFVFEWRRTVPCVCHGIKSTPLRDYVIVGPTPHDDEFYGCYIDKYNTHTPSDGIDSGTDCFYHDSVECTAARGTDGFLCFGLGL